MMNLLIGGAVGFLVGWLFFARPKWVVDLWAKWFEAKK